jgi:PhoPQ-activated pathogenicity-related protein
MAKKKRYKYDEVIKMMKEKYGNKAPYINHTQNYEPDLKYRINTTYYQTLAEIVDKFKLEE